MWNDYSFPGLLLACTSWSRSESGSFNYFVPVIRNPFKYQSNESIYCSLHSFLISIIHLFIEQPFLLLTVVAAATPKPSKTSVSSSPLFSSADKSKPSSAAAAKRGADTAKRGAAYDTDDDAAFPAPNWVSVSATGSGSKGAGKLKLPIEKE